MLSALKKDFKKVEWRIEYLYGIRPKMRQKGKKYFLSLKIMSLFWLLGSTSVLSQNAPPSDKSQSLLQDRLKTMLSTLPESMCAAQGMLEGRQDHSQCNAASKQGLAPPEERTPRLLIFVSFSMPQPTLQALGQEVQKIGGKLVLRGLINNSFQATAVKLKELGVEALIDPTLFRTYHIEKVPAFVLVGSSSSSSGQISPHDVVYGNVSLAFALEHMSQQGDVEDVSSFMRSQKERS